MLSRGEITPWMSVELVSISCEQKFYLLCQKWELLFGIECVSLVVSEYSSWDTSLWLGHQIHTVLWEHSYRPQHCPLPKWDSLCFAEWWSVAGRCRHMGGQVSVTSELRATCVSVCDFSVSLCYWLSQGRYATNSVANIQNLKKKVLYIYIYI